MSGIFGFTSYTANNLSASLHALDVWNRPYGHESSDLCIIDHSGIGSHIDHFSDRFPAGAPIHRTSEEYVVIDALLYNRDELRPMLDDDTESISDEELLLRLIREKGFDILALVNGDFAGAFYNHNTHEWVLFRDHLGVRPLYYYLDDTLFAFSTDIRGLLALPGADTSVDESALFHRAMGYNDLSPCGTDYERIRCIPPATYSYVRLSSEGYTFESHTYWQMKQRSIRFSTEAEYQSELKRLITDSVQRRLDAVSGLVGAELSGGLDSSVIDILINRLGRECRYYSWSVSPKLHPISEGEDERKVILDICKQEGISCHFPDERASESTDSLLKSIAPPFVNTLELSRGSSWLKSQGAKVVFTGHGGDEGVSHRANRFELWFNHEYLAYLRLYWMDTENKNLRILRTLKRSYFAVRNQRKHLLGPYINRSYNSRAILHEDFKKRMAPLTNHQPLFFSFAPHKYIMQGGTRIRLENAAYQGAMNGVRYLYPYIDHRVIDFSVSIPRRLYLDHDMNRKIFREAFKDIIPLSLYEVNYKDMASQRTTESSQDLPKLFHDDIEPIRSKLDRDYWKGILNFDMINKLELREGYTIHDVTFLFYMRHELNRCLLIQNAGKNAVKWCLEHD